MSRFVGAVCCAVLVAVVATGIGAEAEAAEAACVPPTCIETTVPVPAGLTVPDSRVRVLLPEGYDGHPCRRYPVLYLLHGVGDTFASWSDNSDVVAFTRQFPVIVVMPDGGKTPEAGWYSDWVDGSRQWESFHVDVLVPWVERTFRTVPGRAHRAVAGFSMGGFGAMSYAARHPDLFAAAASISGMVDSMYGYPASGPGFALAGPHAGTPDDRVWGDQIQNEAEWRAHNPTDRAADLRGMALFLFTGMGTPGGARGENPEKGANYGVESFIFQMNVSFMRALDAAGVPYQSDVHPGYHDWPYYEAGLHWSLPRVMDVIATPDALCPPIAAAGPPGSRRGGGGSGDGDGDERRAGPTPDELPATGGGVPVGLGLAGLAAAALVRAAGPNARSLRWRDGVGGGTGGDPRPDRRRARGHGGRHGGRQGGRHGSPPGPGGAAPGR